MRLRNSKGQRVGWSKESGESVTLLQRVLCGVHSVEGTSAHESAEAETGINEAEAIGKKASSRASRGERLPATRTRGRRRRRRHRTKGEEVRSEKPRGGRKRHAPLFHTVNQAMHEAAGARDVLEASGERWTIGGPAGMSFGMVRRRLCIGQVGRARVV